MDAGAKLFDNQTGYCAWCHRPLKDDAESDLCQSCQESMQFREIREYVRKHDVNEFQLAETFDIPLRKVKQWIREGRLEYKDNVLHRISTLHCQNCGKEIKFGNLCPECTRASYGVRGGFEKFQKNDVDEQMRYYDKKRK